MKLTEVQKAFIGEEFTTCKGNTLTVVSFKAKLPKRCPTYFLHCNVCSEDEELFPKDSIVSTKGNLTGGQIPCGCSKKPQWSIYQNEVRAKRRSKVLGFDFKGWAEPYKGDKTKVILQSLTTGKEWDSVIFSNLLNKDISDKTIPTAKNVKTDEYHIEGFIRAGFPLSTSFKNLGGGVWEYDCPSCSFDEFVVKKVCTGKFKGQTSHLKRGKKACRCSKSYRWNEDHRLVQIRNIEDEEGLTFLGWESEFENARTKLLWVCREGHRNSTPISSFITRGVRCNECSRKGNIYGFYPEKVSCTDYLYILSFNSQYSKCGRAFSISRRIHNSGTGIIKMSGYSREDIEVVAVYTGTHQQVWDTEQWLLKETKDRGFYYNSGWTTESRTVDALPLLIKLVEEHSDLTKVDHVEGM